MSVVEFSQYDRNMIEYLTAVLNHGPSTKEIFEEGIADIEVAASSTWNRNFRPVDGKAKWFRDELGQLWVKFTVSKKEWDDDIQYVFPASRVVCVTYYKSPAGTSS